MRNMGKRMDRSDKKNIIQKMPLPAKIDYLKGKALWIRNETLKIHHLTPETRIASCLSCVEIFAALYYGGVLSFDPRNIRWQQRDRLIVSKAHGAISLYPILADFGFFGKKGLEKVYGRDSTLGAIPDCLTPGFESINGSLGHGLGVACGIALALKNKKLAASVFVLLGDGELYEGAVWEAIMFAAHHKLDNLILIIDKNEKCMLDYCKNVLDLDPLENKFKAFNWQASSVDGHNLKKTYLTLKKLKATRNRQPKVLIAHTVKGKGIARLETDPMCHIKSLTKEEVGQIIGNTNE
jgi:transketolase